MSDQEYEIYQDIVHNFEEITGYSLTEAYFYPDVELFVEKTYPTLQEYVNTTYSVDLSDRGEILHYLDGKIWGIGW